MRATQPPGGHDAAGESPAGALRILLVEDDPAYARLVHEYLKDSQFPAHAVETVGALRAATSVLARGSVDVVIADLGLPDAIGDEVVPTLRTADPRVPIVILSGQSDIDKALRSMQQGAQEYLVKGRNEDFFLSRAVRAAIERKRVEEFEKLLVGVVSHDLRGPLQALSTLVEMQELDGHATELTGLARRSLTRAIALANDLLDFTKLRLSGLLPIVARSADLAACVTAVADELRLSHPERTITVELHGDTRGWFDAARMAQVASNLLGNALQHSPPDTPVIVRCSGAGQALTFEVTNRGDAIPGELLGKLFRPLERLESQGRTPGSIGLGLYITDQIVRAHGGAIAVTSTADDGTVFRVTLPRERAATSAAAGANRTG